MTYITCFKTSPYQGGFLINGYWANRDFVDQLDFWNWCAYCANFDLAWSGSQSELVAMVAYPANKGTAWQRNHAYFWGAVGPGPRGRIAVFEPLPWRWCLNLGLYPRRGRPSHHAYHGALMASDIAWNEHGDVMLKWDDSSKEKYLGRLGDAGGKWPEWFMFGVGSSVPAEALTWQEARYIVPCGVTIKTKQRRAQAMLLQEGLNLQARAIANLQDAAIHFGELARLHTLNTGHWVPAELRRTTTSLMGSVLAFAQMYKDANEGENGRKINDDQGWLTRWGATGATLADTLSFFELKQHDDMKWLQKFPTFADVSGDEYFEQANALEWFKVAFDWADYVGAFAHFDFLNPNQEGLKNMERLDNFTPLWPDLPLKVEGLPRPPKNPERKIALPGLIGSVTL